MAKAPKDATGKPRFGKHQPAHYCGKPGRSGPPRNNRNAMRHGLRGGQLPKDARYIEHRLNRFRRLLEDAVLGARGEVTLTDAAAIQTCLRWERHAALAQRWLVKQGNTLKLVDRLKFSEAIAKASDSRDKALAALKLDRDAKDNIIDTLYAYLPSPKADGDGPT